MLDRLLQEYAGGDLEDATPDEVIEVAEDNAREEWLEARRGKITGSNFTLLMDRTPDCVKNDAQALESANSEALSMAVASGKMKTREALEVIESAGKEVLDGLRENTITGPQALAIVRVEPGKAKQNAIVKAGEIESLMARNSPRSLDPKKVFSKTAITYLNSVVAEHLGSTIPSFTSRPTDWGNDHEQEAIEAYAQRTGFEVTSGTHRFIGDAMMGLVGSTPDFLVESQMISGEVKCPHNPAVHVATLINQSVPKEYAWQPYAHMGVQGTTKCDFVSFDPRIEEGNDARLCVIRVDRDDAAMEELTERLILAQHYVLDTVCDIKSLQVRKRFHELWSTMSVAERNAAREAMEGTRE